MQKRRVWIENGKLRGMQHVSYAEYKREKSKFRKVQRNAIFEFENQQLIDINESSEHDIRLFWRLINMKKNKKANNCTEISYHGHTAKNPEGIANVFAEYFADLYSFCDESENLDNEHTQHSNQLNLSAQISVDDITKQLKSLKKRKAPGIDKVQNEHLIYGGRTLFQCLSVLYSSMLTQNYIPFAWKTGLTIPIYKGCNILKTNPDSNRAISL
ncbi:MAG: hypothetical protein ACH255_20920, partial [Candidatus Thiodiazotropha sp.]